MQVRTCAHGKQTQQHITLVLCGGHVVRKLWTGKAQSRKALREDRVGLDDIRRKTAHRVPEEPTSDRHPSRRLREREAAQRTFRLGVRRVRYFWRLGFPKQLPLRDYSRTGAGPGPVAT